MSNNDDDAARALEVFGAIYRRDDHSSRPVDGGMSNIWRLVLDDLDQRHAIINYERLDLCVCDAHTASGVTDEATCAAEAVRLYEMSVALRWDAP